jgi:integration host factor subunit beta
MTKSDLIRRLALRHPQFPAADAEIFVNTILSAMANTLAEGHRIEIRGFGSFRLNYRPPRKGRNPRSGESLSVPAKYVRISSQARNCASGLISSQRETDQSVWNKLEQHETCCTQPLPPAGSSQCGFASMCRATVLAARVRAVMKRTAHSRLKLP